MPADQAESFKRNLAARGGETGRLIASRDWTGTPLGPVESWPQSLKTAVGIMATTRHPVFIFWGLELACLYNDAYAASLGPEKHPAILGLPAPDAFPEAYPLVAADLAQVMAGGEATWAENNLVPITRNGRVEEVYWTYSYGPILDAGAPNGVGGVVTLITETTKDVVARRDNEERYRTLFESIDDGFCVIEVLFDEGERPVDYRFVEVNPAFERQTGLRNAAGRLARDLAPGLEQHWFDTYGRVALTGEPAQFESPAKALGDRWFDVYGFRVGEPSRRRVGILFSDISARRRAEAALRDEEARFRLMADAVPQIVWITDAEGRVEFFNKQWSDYTGVPYEPTTAAEVAAAYVHPDDAGITMEAFEEACRTRGVFAVEHRIRSRSGAYRWFLVRAEPYPDPVTGRVLRWFGASVDIHDRKLAEAALHGLNATLEAQVAERTAERDRIWQLSPDLMLVARNDGTMLSANPAWERLLGWTPDWLAGRNAAEIKHPDDAERTAAELGRLAGGRHRTINFEDRYRHRDGSWRWFSWVIEPEGEILYCIGRDVTAEREARAALQAAEEARREADALYRAYFENTPEALFVIGVGADGGFVVEELNPAHEAGVGFKLEDVRGKRIEDLLPPDVADRLLATYRRVVETGEVHQFREVYDLADDPQHWDTSLFPVRDAEGRITRLIGSSRNVTRQILAEDALRQAQKMEAVGQLTGGIAHDFNNLLGALVASLDLIRRKPGDADRVKRFAEAGLEAAERGAKLTGQLLAFSRAQRIELKPVVVADLVQGMGDLLARTLGPMVRLDFRIDGDGAVLSDATQLEMAVLNLAINARDAMTDGGDLTIGTRRHQAAGDGELPAGEYVELSVADTGTGMPPEVAARAFDPFFTTKGVGRGTGLGLSQVYGIARQAGGTVRIESRPGAGTTVRLYLPRTSATSPSASAAEASSAVEEGASATILVVDDDPDVRRMLVASLDALGYRVLEAADGPSGLAVLDGSEPDLMMVDFAMPGMNGAEVARTARERRPDLPIVFASGYADTAAIEAVAGTRTAVLRKPFRVADLQAVLAAALGGRS